MKRTFLVLSLLLLALGWAGLPVSAQYLSFPDSGASWKIDQYNSDILWGCSGVTTSRYTLQGTFMANGHLYQNADAVGFAYCDPGACPGGNPVYPGTGIRTDTVTGKVYAILNGQPEELIFDYALQPGDTLYSNVLGLYSGPLVVDSVDTVTWGGLTRRRQFFQTWPSPAWVVEGIGSSAGLFSSFGNGVNGEWNQLVCYSENGTSLFSRSDLCSSGVGCEVVVGRGEPISTLLSVGPNPVRDRIEIQGAEGFQLRMIDLQGRAIWQTTPETKTQTVNVSKIPRGIYFLEAWENGQRITSHKLILQ